MSNIPPCANWNLWIGPEIEGYSQLGVLTLFVRNASYDDIEYHSRTVDRIWFDTKFDDISVEFIKKIKTLNKKIIFDLTLDKYYTLVQQNRFDILDEQLYLRINNISLKTGDHIKLGSEFHEEAFEIGTGKKSYPELYYNDIFIK